MLDLTEVSPPPAKKAKTEAPVASIFNMAKPKKEASPKKKEAEKEGPKPAKPSSQNGKPLASIFQKPVKVEKPKDDDEHVPADDDEGEDEISDEEMEEQEEKAASKL